METTNQKLNITWADSEDEVVNFFGIIPYMEPEPIIFGDSFFLQKFRVPMKFNHSTCIDKYKQKLKIKPLKNEEGRILKHEYSEYFTSKNFIDASSQFIPGATYVLKQIPILSGWPSLKECIERCREEPHFAGFFGAQGVTFVDINLLSKEKYYASVDYPENSFQFPDPYEDHEYGIPVLHTYDVHPINHADFEIDLDFRIEDFRSIFTPKCLLLVFCKS